MSLIKNCLQPTTVHAILFVCLFLCLFINFFIIIIFFFFGITFLLAGDCALFRTLSAQLVVGNIKDGSLHQFGQIEL